MIDTTYTIKESEFVLETESAADRLEDSIKHSLEMHVINNKRMSYEVKRMSQTSIIVRTLDLGLSVN